MTRCLFNCSDIYSHYYAEGLFCWVKVNSLSYCIMQQTNFKKLEILNAPACPRFIEWVVTAGLSWTKLSSKEEAISSSDRQLADHPCCLWNGINIITFRNYELGMLLMEPNASKQWLQSLWKQRSHDTLCLFQSGNRHCCRFYSGIFLCPYIVLCINRNGTHFYFVW